MSEIMTKRGWVQLCPTTINSNQPPDKTLLQELGLEPESIADQYCTAIQDFVSGRNTNKDYLADIMGQRNVVFGKPIISKRIE